MDVTQIADQDTVLGNDIRYVGELNGRLYDIRCRLSAMFDRLNGPEATCESTKDSACPPSPSGDLPILFERISYAHAHAATIEAILTDLERLV